MSRPVSRISLFVLVIGCAGSSGSPPDSGKDPGADPGVIQFDPGSLDPGAADPDLVPLPDPDPGPGPDEAGLPDDPGTLEDVSSIDEGITEDLGNPPGQIAVVPPLVDFGFVPSGKTLDITVSVQNLGTVPLTITKLIAQGSPELTLVLEAKTKVSGNKTTYTLEPPREVAPGGSFDFPVRFLPVQPKEVHAEVKVISSDPAWPGGYLFYIVGNKDLPCLSVDPPVLDFGPVVVGSPVDRTMKIDSCGTGPLSLVEMALDAPGAAAGFSLAFDTFPGGTAPSEADPLVIEPGKPVLLKVRFAPPKASGIGPDGKPVPAHGSLRIRGDLFAGSEFFPIQGIGLDKACATPVVTVQEPSKVAAGTLIHLSGIQSHSAFGSIAGYAWSVQQPPGSGGDFLPGNDVRDVTFLPAVSGIYKFSLQVTDSAGNASCGPASVAVEVTTSGQIVVLVLTWKPVSPFTPKPTHPGPDLDLHFLHPSAAGPDVDKDGKPDGWYDLPWDCFWFNPKPDWDNHDVYLIDDPTLASQSESHLAPEVMHMGTQCPKANLYRFGVHFFDDFGYGPVHATLRVFVNDALALEQQATLSKLDLWEVGTYSCFPTSVAAKPGPFILHGYMNPNFVVP
jgi:hypothetical protein